MSYADETYYKNIYEGTAITENIDSKLSKASDQIDSLTYNRIVGIGIDNLTDFQKDKVKKAVCMQADFTEQYGEYINSPLASFSAGSISVSLNSNSVKNINGVVTSNEVATLLIQTGLTCRRI